MANYLNLKDDIDAQIKEFHQAMTALSDDLADNPEVSGSEYKTSEKIVDYLKKQEYQVEFPFAGIDTAFKATYGADNHKYKIAVLTEYDALPEIGHACGHNISCAISLLAGISLKGLQNQLDADIHIIGTPNEEADGAKCAMSDQGIFKQYDMAMMVHLYDQNLVYCTLNGLASFMYNFHGKASHAGAAPWDGQNAMNAAQLMLHGIDCIRGCTKPDARINSVIFKGGFAGGSIPEEAQLETWVRYPEYSYLEKLIERVDNCAKGGALMAECTWDKYLTAAIYKSMKRNYAGEDAIAEVFGELRIEINGDHEKLFGSSDIGNVSFECPAFHPTLQLVDRGIAIHTREFLAAVKSEKAHQCIEDGAKLIAYTVAKIFTDEGRIKQMKADFQGGA